MSDREFDRIVQADNDRLICKLTEVLWAGEAAIEALDRLETGPPGQLRLRADWTDDEVAEFRRRLEPFRQSRRPGV